MQELREHEIFELEVLENLGKAGFLKRLVFGGGTMMRLCHGLPRYSVDLDFWFSKKVIYSSFDSALLRFFRDRYRMTDAKNKHYSLLYEFKGSSPRKLKIEIRKEIIKTGLESQIAYSPFSTRQVLVRALSLEESAKRKLLAMASRNEIRDYFDLEFMLRRGVEVHWPESAKAAILRRIHEFKKSDFSGILGALLEKDLRVYYSQRGFSYLVERISQVKPTSE